MRAIRNTPGPQMLHRLQHNACLVVEGDVNRKAHEERMHYHPLRSRNHEFHVVRAGFAEHQAHGAFQESICKFHFRSTLTHTVTPLSQRERYCVSIAKRMLEINLIPLMLLTNICSSLTFNIEINASGVLISC